MCEKDFLAYLDEKYEKTVHLKNRGYIEYTEIFTKDIAVGNRFFFAKTDKTRIILMHKNIWVDFTDADLINIISCFDQKLFDQLIIDLRLGINENWTDFEFEIDNHRYCGKGINYSNYDDGKEIYLPMDFSITIKELVFIINLIIYKDIIGQKYVKDRDKNGILIQRTLTKYISLLLYIKKHDVDAKDYLEVIGYPVSKLEQYLQKNVILKKYDKKFGLVGFEKLAKT